MSSVQKSVLVDFRAKHFSFAFSSHCSYPYPIDLANFGWKIFTVTSTVFRKQRSFLTSKRDKLFLDKS